MLIQISVQPISLYPGRMTYKARIARIHSRLLDAQIQLMYLCHLIHTSSYKGF